MADFFDNLGLQPAARELAKEIITAPRLGVKVFLNIAKNKPADYKQIGKRLTKLKSDFPGREQELKEIIRRFKKIRLLSFAAGQEVLWLRSRRILELKLNTIVERFEETPPRALKEYMSRVENIARNVGPPGFRDCFETCLRQNLQLFLTKTKYGLADLEATLGRLVKFYDSEEQPETAANHGSEHNFIDRFEKTAWQVLLAWEKDGIFTEIGERALVVYHERWEDPDLLTCKTLVSQENIQHREVIGTEADLSDHDCDPAGLGSTPPGPSRSSDIDREISDTLQQLQVFEADGEECGTECSQETAPQKSWKEFLNSDARSILIEEIREGIMEKLTQNNAKALVLEDLGIDDLADRIVKRLKNEAEGLVEVR